MQDKDIPNEIIETFKNKKLAALFFGDRYMIPNGNGYYYKQFNAGYCHGWKKVWEFLTHHKMGQELPDGKAIIRVQFIEKNYYTYYRGDPYSFSYQSKKD